MAIKSVDQPNDRGHSTHREDIAYDQGANVPDLTITWTANEPTAGDAQTIADGDVPTVAELGQAVANLTAKLNAALEVLKDNGLMIAD